jgi:SAM-dependent methyltransferase
MKEQAMTSQIQRTDEQHPILRAIVHNTLHANDHELLRHLAEVLGISTAPHVLLIASPDARAALEHSLGSEIEAYDGDLRRLPFADQQFDSALVAVPITQHLHAVARELSRVLKPNGSLGLVVFSLYRDQMPEDTRIVEQIGTLAAAVRPAAAYRAVLAESGFTAFVSEDRRAELRRSALASYRQHLLPADATPPADEMSQALSLMAAGSIALTLITAEKGL